MSIFEKISPDDPRLTAFALDEMEPAERAEFEQLLQRDADARATVAAIAGTVRDIGVALTSEPMPTLVPSKPDPQVSRIDREYDRPSGGLAQMLRFPQLYFTISGLAAACFAIGFLIWQQGREPVRQYTEVDLTKFGPVNTPTVKVADETGTESDGGSLVGSAESDDGMVSFNKTRKDNDFLTVENEPVSAFPITADTAVYSKVRNMIEHGRRPPTDTVRIEGLVNYFPYHYAPPEIPSARRAPRAGHESLVKNEAPPFAAHLEVASAPWATEHRLVRIGLKGREAPEQAHHPLGSGVPAIAKGVKIAVEFNPAEVRSYRLIGYENRMARPDDTPNERLDAGEFAAGHTVTALYEIVPVGAEMSASDIKYRRPDDLAEKKHAGLLTLTVHYNEPDSDANKSLAFSLHDTGHQFEQASADFKFAASVAAFGMVLRDSPHKGQATFAQVAEWARAGVVDDTGGYRAHFVGLVGQAERLAQN